VPHQGYTEFTLGQRRVALVYQVRSSFVFDILVFYRSIPVAQWIKKLIIEKFILRKTNTVIPIHISVINKLKTFATTLACGGKVPFLGWGSASGAMNRLKGGT
jgi:hypothetical protein